MSAAPAPAADAPTAVEQHLRLRLARGITATWWYTVIAVLFFEAILVLVWMGALFERGLPRIVVFAVGAGGLAWTASTMLLLREYRRRTDTSIRTAWLRLVAPLAIAVAFGAAAGLSTGSWALGILPVVQAAVLLDWPPGVRLRFVVAVTVLVAVVVFVDVRALPTGAPGAGWVMPMVYTLLLPAMTVLSLWWWDVLVTLDRARASEGRLAATQERLRVATDVHDLQGHHLQVIALQLELAERLMPTDAAAGMEQLRAARHSVDDARQGTRDLATRFRSVPLRDELANAVDLLRAAGIAAEAAVDAVADQAPASVLAPVIRETTTNALRHGGGRWARLTLAHDDGIWRYGIANDADPVDPADGGSGLEGIERRIAEAGGTVEVRRERGEFSVLVTVSEGAS